MDRAARSIGADRYACLLALGFLIAAAPIAPAADAGICRQFAEAVEYFSGLDAAGRDAVASRLQGEGGEHKRLLLRALNFVLASPGADNLAQAAMYACLPETPA